VSAVSSNRPFVAARLELWLDRRAEQLLRLFGWTERVITYPGYGIEDSARILGRIVLAPRWSDTQIGKAAEEFLRRRGWRNFVTAATVHSRYTIEFGDVTVSGSTDRGGYIDHRLRGHGCPVGWQTATITLGSGLEFGASVQIVPNDETFGVVSDLDDTVISTMLPRPLIAAWNSFFRTEAARQAVPGMAALYRQLLAKHPHAPLVYLSTGAWNTQGFLRRFLKRHGFPDGSMLMTDWGPTNTGWFRSGLEHKRASLLQLSIDFPQVRWILVGDDGQHDPEIYGDFAEAHPDRVRAVLIRRLNPTEQFLAHGTLEPIEPTRRRLHPGTPIIQAPDGRALASKLRDLPGVAD